MAPPPAGHELERTTAGAIFPESATVVSFRDDGAVTVEDLAAGTTLTADGVLANELRRAIAAQPPSGRVAALGGDAESLVARVTELTRSARLPLNRTTALALGGFEMLFAELTGRCNLTCRHCYAGSGPEVTAALSREACEAVVRDAATLGFRRLQFTGGEPLLCAFLPELVAQARALGIEQVEIFTNGTLLDDALLARLAPHRPDFAMSFYAGEASVHDTITGIVGSQQRTTVAIERVLAAGLCLRAAIVATVDNAKQIPAAIAHLEGLGVTQIRTSGSYAVGRGAYFDRPPAESTPPERREPGEARAHRGTLCVAYTGEVFPCIFNRASRLGRVTDRSLVAIARDPDLQGSATDATADTRRLACSNCRLTQSALRACGQVA